MIFHPPHFELRMNCERVNLDLNLLSKESTHQHLSSVRDFFKLCIKESTHQHLSSVRGFFKLGIKEMQHSALSQNVFRNTQTIPC